MEELQPKLIITNGILSSKEDKNNYMETTSKNSNNRYLALSNQNKMGA